VATSTAQWFSEQQSGVRSADNRVADREIATAITDRSIREGRA